MHGPVGIPMYMLYLITFAQFMRVCFEIDAAAISFLLLPSIFQHTHLSIISPDTAASTLGSLSSLHSPFHPPACPPGASDGHGEPGNGGGRQTVFGTPDLRPGPVKHGGELNILDESL